MQEVPAKVPQQGICLLAHLGECFTFQGHLLFLVFGIEKWDFWQRCASRLQAFRLKVYRSQLCLVRMTLCGTVKQCQNNQEHK